MKKFALIGNPVYHSISPILHKIIYKKLKIDAEYIKIEIQSDRFSNFIKTNKYYGLNITIPYKERVIPMLKSIDKTAKIIGAVNCLLGFKGFNTDWEGFLKSMEINNIELKNKNCLILGAGGAARAIAYALFISNVRSINFRNRTKNRLNEIMTWLSSFYKNNKINSNPDIIINCTPLGMYPDIDSVPIKFENINNKQILIDTIYNPCFTKWLKIGKRRGLKVIGGMDMLIAQGLYSVNNWLGIDTFENIDFLEIREELNKYNVS